VGRYRQAAIGRIVAFRCRGVTLKLDGRETTQPKTVLVAVALGTESGTTERSRAIDLARSAHGVVRYNRFESTMLPLLAYPSPCQAARYRC
jgi:hypothetical protein